MNLNKVDLNLFIVFDAIYTEANLTRAGQIVGITQPAVSNALSRTRNENRSTLMSGGHYNDLLPYDLRNTDGATRQPQTSCRVTLTKLHDWPDFLKSGSTVYDFVDAIRSPRGKGGLQ